MTSINDNRMNLSETEAWETLYQDIPILLQPGEKTVRMMMDELGRDVEFKTMQRYIDLWVKDGKLEYIGKRINNGKPADAYKMVV